MRYQGHEIALEGGRYVVRPVLADGSVGARCGTFMRDRKQGAA